MKNDFYSWLDAIAQKKAQDWSLPPMSPLSTDEVYTQMLNDPTYNYKTFYEQRPFMAQRMLNEDPYAHFDDIGKTMYHPTFSDQSAFSGYVNDYNPLGIVGGHWNEEGTEYTPSESQLNNYWNYNTTRKYLDNNEQHPVKIIIPQYTTGKGSTVITPPSNSIRKIIAQYEGAHFVGQNKKFGGDAIAAKNKELYNRLGAAVYNALSQNSRDALLSYYYNISPNGFEPTKQALLNWYNNGRTYDGLSQVKDTINIGMNRPGMSGLRKRRLYEQDLFMKGQNPTGFSNGNLNQQVPADTVQIPMDPQQIQKVISMRANPYENIRTILDPKITIPLKPEIYPTENGWTDIQSNDHGKSGIHINPANRGKFNATKKRTGKSTDELVHSKNPLTRKRAIFAQNARKWKH